MAQEKKDTPKRSTKKTSSKTQTPEQEQTLRIEVSRFESIIEALGGPKWFRMLFSICFLSAFIFCFVFIAAFAIKKMYPYSDITTNGLGATTLKSEKGEVSYWLFNTASLWANSGITVEEGDIITIRSSGKFNTAIHHLYNSAENNTKLKDDWVDAGGIEDNQDDTTGNYQRRKFRIFPGLPTGALVMQVANNKPFDTAREDDAKSDDFYFIGKERQHIYINNPGTLYFSLNETVLNDRTIREMIYDCLVDTLDKTEMNLINDSIKKIKKNNKDATDASLLDNLLFDKFNKYYLKGTKINPGRKLGKMKLGITTTSGKPICELQYYHEKEYKTAWFDDNVGSFLIIIEKQSK